MINKRDLLTTEVQSPPAYSTLTGKPAATYLKEIGAEPKGVSTVHIIFGTPSNEVPEEIRKFVPPDLQHRLEYSRQHYQDRPEAFGLWYLTSTATRFDNKNDRPDQQITPDNLANMFTTATTVVTERGDNSRGIPWQNNQTKNSVISGQMYCDMFVTGVNALLASGTINREQRHQMFQQKIDALRANPTSIFNFRFEGSFPLDELKELDSPPAYVSTLLSLIDQWDTAQSEAVIIIAASDNSKVKIAGLLTDGTPGAVVDSAVKTAEGKKGDVNKLIEWSKEIPVDQVYEAVTSFGELSEKTRQIIDHRVANKRNWKSLKGEKTSLGDYTLETKENMGLLLSVLKLNNFDIFSATPSEREILEQRLSAWADVSHPDKRVHIPDLKPLLRTGNGVDALDRVHSISTYLLSISHQAGKE